MSSRVRIRFLRTGAFEITFLDENLPDIKGEWCRMVAEGNADSLRGFPRFNEERRQSGRHCRALRCLLQKREALVQVIEDVRWGSDANTRQAA